VKLGRVIDIDGKVDDEFFKIVREIRQEYG
jgi:hypothetical protein